MGFFWVLVLVTICVINSSGKSIFPLSIWIYVCNKTSKNLIRFPACYMLCCLILEQYLFLFLVVCPISLYWFLMTAFFILCLVFLSLLGYIMVLADQIILLPICCFLILCYLCSFREYSNRFHHGVFFCNMLSTLFSF